MQVFVNKSGDGTESPSSLCLSQMSFDSCSASLLCSTQGTGLPARISNSNSPKTRQRESDNEVDIPEENRSSNDAVDDSSKDSNGSESPCPVDEFGELSINTLNYKHTFL